MSDDLMADSVTESSKKSGNDSSGSKHFSSSLFSFSGFFVGFGGGKGSSEPDSVRSPTSPLDFLSNFSNLFSPRSPIRSSFQNSPRSKCDAGNVGLCMVHSLADEIGSCDKEFTSVRSDSIVFGPQVKMKSPKSSRHYGEWLDPPSKSNSLPKNYMPHSLFQTVVNRSQLSDDANGIHDDDDVAPPNSEAFKQFSSSTENPKLSSKNFSPVDESAKRSSPMKIGRVLQVKSSSAIKPSSLPGDTVSSKRNGLFSGSFSAREMTLSEDYTCIISHGPNPKTTHIFGECILECHPDELASVDQQEEHGMNSPQAAGSAEDPRPYLYDELSSYCYSCKKKLQKGDEIYAYRHEKAFCSFKCNSSEIFGADEEMNGHDVSPKTSTNLDHDDDIFAMGFQ